MSKNKLVVNVPLVIVKATSCAFSLFAYYALFFIVSLFSASDSLQQNSKSPAMAAFKLPTFSFPSSSSSSSPAAAAPKAAPAAAAAEKK